MVNYDLIGGLFTKPAPATAPRAVSPQAQPCTKCTWKISDEHWEEFTALAKLSQKTQADLINELIAKAVEENTKEISEYLKFFSKK